MIASADAYYAADWCEPAMDIATAMHKALARKENWFSLENFGLAVNTDVTDPDGGETMYELPNWDYVDADTIGAMYPRGLPTWSLSQSKAHYDEFERIADKLESLGIDRRFFYTIEYNHILPWMQSHDQ
jgi:hypothetical protein